MPPIKAIFFDCDNTLVLSEEHAFEGCAKLANEIFEKHGVKLDKPFTGKGLETDYVGQNFRKLMANLQDKYNFKMAPEELEEYNQREEDVLISIIRKELKECPGASKQLEACEKSGKHVLAVVSSSALRRVVASLETVGQDKFFGDRVYSASTSLPTPTSKPDPAIYLYAAAKQGFKPNECVAIEDSRTGATAAVRAGITMIGYLGPYHGKERDDMRALLKEIGATAMLEHWDDFPQVMASVEEKVSKL